MADGFVGKKTTMKIIDLGDGRIASHTTIEGHPEMNSCCVTKEGIDNHVNVPHLGGKCVVTYNKHGNGFKSVIKTEKMGTWNMEEEISTTPARLKTQHGMLKNILHFLMHEIGNYLVLCSKWTLICVLLA